MQLHTGSHSLPKYIRGLGYLGGHAWVALFDSRTLPLKTVGFAGCHLCTDGWGGEEGAEEGTERERRYSDFPHSLKKTTNLVHRPFKGKFRFYLSDVIKSNCIWMR